MRFGVLTGGGDCPGLNAVIRAIVRAVLLPAAMKLLGERNWYLPRHLRWLPKFEHEPTTAEA